MHKDRKKFIIYSIFDQILMFIGLKENLKIMEIFIENVPNHVILI